MFKNLKIGIRLMLSLFLIAIISVSVIGVITYNKSKIALEKESFNRLTAIRELKASQIETYFGEIRNQILTFSNDPTIIDAMKEFTSGFNSVSSDLNYNVTEYDSIHHELSAYYTKNYLPKLNENLTTPSNIDKELSTCKETNILQDLYIVNNPNKLGEKLYFSAADDKSSYTRTHLKYHPFIQDYLAKFGYYDIFLIEPTSGHIVYTVYKEVDFGTSLIDGPFSNTGIAKVFLEASKSYDPNFLKVIDYEPYHPSYNTNAAFISSPIFENDSLIGVLCFQLPIDKINAVMTNSSGWEDAGLGKSGETYIVGSDYKLRNQSRLLIEDSQSYFEMIQDIYMPDIIIDQIKNLNTTIGLQEVKTKGTEAALSKKTGTEIFKDNRGVNVLSSYKPLEIEGLEWVIMSEIDEEEAFEPVYELKAYIISVFGVLLLLISAISYVMAKRITQPLKNLTSGAKQLAKGNMDAHIEVYGKDEIGILALSFKKMQISIKNLITELQDINQNLEHKVKQRTKKVEEQRNMLSEKNKEIIDSINYAKRIQSAILPPEKLVKKYLKKSFILYKPKDIVAGDFYWMETIVNDKTSNKQTSPTVLFAAADCTGHGVPGAMVSVVCHNALNRAVREHKLYQPSKILDKTRDIIIEEFEKSEEAVKDGMDIALCSLNGNQLQYAGAHNPLWIVRHSKFVSEDDKHFIKQGEENGFVLLEIKANKEPIGKFDNLTPYTNHELTLEKGDAIYLFSDGFVDQFGGEKGKKFKTKAFRGLLLTIQDKNMEEQKNIINASFEEWKGNIEQVDDVCVIGVKI